MSARRKNSKALKNLHRRGLNIDGNFTVSMESAVNFKLDKFDQKYFTEDHCRRYLKLDIMFARQL